MDTSVLSCTASWMTELSLSPPLSTQPGWAFPGAGQVSRWSFSGDLRRSTHRKHGEEGGQDKGHGEGREEACMPVSQHTSKRTPQGEEAALVTHGRGNAARPARILDSHNHEQFLRPHACRSGDFRSSVSPPPGTRADPTCSSHGDDLSAKEQAPPHSPLSKPWATWRGRAAGGEVGQGTQRDGGGSRPLSPASIIQPAEGPHPQHLRSQCSPSATLSRAARETRTSCKRRRNISI